MSKFHLSSGRLNVVLGGLFAFAASFLAVLPAPSAEAVTIPNITNQAPRQGDFDNTTNRKIRFVVGHDGAGNSLDAPRSVIKVYSSSPSVTVRIINYNNCTNNTDLSDFAESVRTPSWDTAFTWGTYDFGTTPATQEPSGEGWSYNRLYTGLRSSMPSWCNDELVFNMTNLKRSSGLGRDDLYEGYVLAVNNSAMYGYSDRNGGLNAFRVQVNVPSGGTAMLGYANDNADALGEFVVQNRVFWDESNSRMLSDAELQYRTFNIPFAPDCTITNSTSYTIRWFDDDYNASAQGFFRGLSDTRNIKMRLYRAPASIPHGSLTSSDFSLVTINYTGPDGVTQSGTTIEPRGGDDEAQQATIQLEPGYRYIWQWQDVWDRNGVQLKIPFDAVYFERPCPDPELTSLIELNPSPVVMTGEQYTGKFRLRNDNSTYAGRVNWEAFIFNNRHATDNEYNAGTDSIVGPTYSGSNRVVNPGSTIDLVPSFSGTASMSSFGPHGRICAYVRITPILGEIAVNPYVTCISIGKVPKMHIKNGDITVGGGDETLGCSVDPDKAILQGVNSAAFGLSKAEYGVLAFGGVYGFGSNDGSSSSLTFANTPKVGFLQGESAANHCLNSPFRAGLFIEAEELDAASVITEVSGSTKYIGSIGGTDSDLVIKKGESVIVRAADGNSSSVRINKNIIYEDTTYEHPSQLPRFAILTNGYVYIHDKVTRLDGIYGTRGTVYSCWPASTKQISMTHCDDQLTVNGQLFVGPNRAFIPWRTAGGDDTSPTQPAELLNLHPATVLSEHRTPEASLRTTVIEELPPRF